MTKKVYHVKCSETVEFTVSIEAESEEEARELAVEDINSHEVIAESTTDWDIDEIIQSKKSGIINPTQLD